MKKTIPNQVNILNTVIEVTPLPNAELECLRETVAQNSLSPLLNSMIENSSVDINTSTPLDDSVTFDTNSSISADEININISFNKKF